MENKYYTPSIEEFHYGFEFERNEAHRVYYKPNMPVEYKWVSKKWDEHQIRLGNLKCEIFGKNIRVKYLDKEDIEKSGFIFNWEEGDTSVYDKKDFTLTYTRAETNSLLIIKDNRMSNGKIFVGKIKNKSELSKLLKQLNIL